MYCMIWIEEDCSSSAHSVLLKVGILTLFEIDSLLVYIFDHVDPHIILCSPVEQFFYRDFIIATKTQKHKILVLAIFCGLSGFYDFVA